ncbi:flagellar biosynthetic protein FliO [Cellulomonas endometrii]|uniref:flagellar biosynthetic protein FliO n=1 Tax=Cellulomonas endometrii TaxID=3036301 RepID=UPI0024ADDEF9|nr:flagellar biosynthetic protein FliO [Cellulomonas endometrii]
MDSLVLGLRVLLALACVIGLIWVLARRAGWGKGRRRPAGPAVEVVGRQALGRHAGVAVVAVGNRRLLLGYGEQNVTMLTELAPAPAEVTPLTADDAGTAGTPMTLGALAAAVLPNPRGPRTPKTVRAESAPAAAATAATPSFEAVLASAQDDAGLAGLAVAEVDDARIETLERTAAEPAAADASGALHGSVLAPSTWKQAVAALRERTVRR